MLKQGGALVLSGIRKPQKSFLFVKVEEIGESGGVENKLDERMLKKAYKEEDSRGLTETQRKTMKKVGARLKS